MDIFDRILGRVRNELPQFNKALLVDFKELQVNNSAEYIHHVWNEAIKLLDGQATYLGYRALTPEERVNYELRSYKNKAKTIEITHTDLDIIRYEFEFEGTKYYSYMHLPFLRDFAITISSTKYYLQFVIADHAFFHIRDGIGIKVLRGPIKFWRDSKFVYTSVGGETYMDDIIRVKVHFRKSNKKDLKTTLLLYMLIHYGFYGLLDKFNIPHDSVQFVLNYDEADTDFEYFRIRGVCNEEMAAIIPTAEDLEKTKNQGFFLKVHKSIMEEGTLLQKRVISSLLYNMQYFEMCNSTAYKSNETLIDKLYNSDTVYKTILGKTIYGMDLPKESQAHNHAEQHLDGFDESYLDEISKHKLRDYGVDCKSIYDLFMYVFCNLDEWIVNYAPMRLYGKKFAVNEILLSGIVQAIFKRIYGYTRHKRPLTDKEFAGIVRAGSREITKMFRHVSLVRSSKAAYNDNYLLAMGGKKIRATGSGSGNTASAGSKKRSKKNIAEREEFLANSTMFVVESTNNYPSQNPGLGGSVNPFGEIEPNTGVIIEPEHAKGLREYDRVLAVK